MLGHIALSTPYGGSFALINYLDCFGTGLLKPNIWKWLVVCILQMTLVEMLGLIFCFGINVGALVSPIVGQLGLTLTSFRIFFGRSYWYISSVCITILVKTVENTSKDSLSYRSNWIWRIKVYLQKQLLLLQLPLILIIMNLLNA